MNKPTSQREIQELRDLGLLSEESKDQAKDDLIDYLERQNEKKKARISELEFKIESAGKNIYDRNTLGSLSFF